MPPKFVQCPACFNNVTKTSGGVKCGRCAVFFHVKCAGVSDLKKASDFICKSCSNTPAPQKGDGSGDIIKRMEELQRSIESKIDTTRSEIEISMNGGFSKLESKVNGLIQNFRNEIGGELKNVKSDVAQCYSVIKGVDEATGAKINALIAKNNVLERRLNRSDILVSGLPNKMDKIRDYVIKIAQLVGVNVSMQDINHCCYIKGSKCILVKFNSVYLRDLVMKNYFKSQPLMLENILGVAGMNEVGDINTAETRVYLKDNLSPASKKLHYICRKLLMQQKIKKFYIKNMDNPKAKVYKLDGSLVYLDIQQCADLLDGCLGDDAVGEQHAQNKE